MCYRSERGEHNLQPRKWAWDGMKQIGLVHQGSMVRAWVVWWAARRPSTSPIIWTSALSRILNSTRGLEPLRQQQRLDLLLNCNNKLKRMVPVTMLRNLNLALNFESIRLVFCLKVFVWYFVWNYLFVILFESICLLFCLKVFIWYFVWKYSFAILFESICLLFCYYELWTARNCLLNCDMNCCEGSRRWMSVCLWQEWRK